MKVFYLIFLFQIWSSGCSFIIPDEVPSILSVIYSNIPTIKKGTDSRLGWGFRLGNRADFQVLVELGPQLNTQPLANQGDNNNNNNKRNTINGLSNVLYAQRQQDKKIISNTDGGKWLDNWSKNMNQHEVNVIEAKPGLAIGEIDAKSVIPEDPVLEKLYKSETKRMNNNNNNTNDNS